MKRSGPLRPGAPIARRTPLKARNERRARQKYARNFGAWADAIRSMPCWFCGTTRAVEAAHMIPRSRGGDRTVLLPACGSEALGGNGCHAYLDAHPRWRAMFVEDARALYDRHNERSGE